MRKSRRQQILTGLIVLFLLIVPKVQGADLDSVSELEAFFDGIFSIQLPAYNIPGAEIAVVKNGEIVFSKGYGFADLEKQIPMIPGTTLHRPGSNTKLLVWISVMQLMEQGRLDLYTDINNYLDFSIPSKTASGKEVPPITLHHLMTHTAGFEDEVALIMVSGADSIRSLGQYVREQLPARIFTPGSVMAYSNYGTTLAAYIVEQVSGQPFVEYVEENILQPLKMGSTTFAQPLPENLISRLSEGYRYQDGKFVPGGFEYVQSYPAGALTSSTLDMSRLIAALLNLGLVEASVESNEQENEEEVGSLQEVRILQEATASIMLKQQFAGHPEIPGMTYGLIEANYNGQRILSHGGDTLLFSTGLYFLPEENVGIYVVYNSLGGSIARNVLIESFMDRYFPLNASEQVLPRPIIIGTEDNYSGLYHSSRANFTGIEALLRILQPIKVSVTPEGYLAVQTAGDTTYYGEVAPGLFQELDGQGRIAFSFDGGKATMIHLPWPGVWLRTPWQESFPFLASLLGVAVLFMLGTILGWIRTLFQNKQRSRSFTIPKLFGLVFILLFFTTVVLLIDMLNTTHPTLGVPLLVFKPSSTLKAILLLTKVLAGLGVLMFATTIYVLITKKGSLWQRLHYVLLTLSSLSVTLVLWQVNLL